MPIEPSPAIGIMQFGQSPLQDFARNECVKNDKTRDVCELFLGGFSDLVLGPSLSVGCLTWRVATAVVAGIPSSLQIHVVVPARVLCLGVVSFRALRTCCKMSPEIVISALV